MSSFLLCSSFFFPLLSSSFLFFHPLSSSFILFLLPSSLCFLLTSTSFIVLFLFFILFLSSLFFFLSSRFLHSFIFLSPSLFSFFLPSPLRLRGEEGGLQAEDSSGHIDARVALESAYVPELHKGIARNALSNVLDLQDAEVKRHAHETHERSQTKKMAQTARFKRLIGMSFSPAVSAAAPL